jgi:hypothetical protein
MEQCPTWSLICSHILEQLEESFPAEVLGKEHRRIPLVCLVVPPQRLQTWLKDAIILVAPLPEAPAPLTDINGHRDRNVAHCLKPVPLPS